MTQQPTPVGRGDRSPDQAGTAVERAVPHPTRTPLFQASGAERYQRQTLIRQIQARTKPWLICYVSGSDCVIDADDAMPFVDLLHNVPPDEDVDLLLHTGGGSIDAAEKLTRMVRSKVGAATFRIIVPDFAKSAGTLMVLGADSVVMSDMSELGPIDPQMPLFGTWQSVQNYLDAYHTHAETLRNDPSDVAAQIMLGKLEPAILKQCEVATDRARQAAEGLLLHGMFRNGGNWSKTASELLETTRWLSHGQMISWEDARDPAIGLVVEYLDYHSETWQDYWRLYCLQRLAVGDRQKLYESDYASLVIGPVG